MHTCRACMRCIPTLSEIILSTFQSHRNADKKSLHRWMISRWLPDERRNQHFSAADEFCLPKKMGESPVFIPGIRSRLAWHVECFLNISSTYFCPEHFIPVMTKKVKKRVSRYSLCALLVRKKTTSEIMRAHSKFRRSLDVPER